MALAHLTEKVFWVGVIGCMVCVSRGRQLDIHIIVVRGV